MNFVHPLFVICYATAVLCGTAGETSSLIGSELCSSGPEIWCQNFTTATECLAVKHCIQTVWSMWKPAQNDKCSMCIDQVNKIRAAMNSHETKDVIEEALDYICEFSILTEIFRKECENVIHNYVDNHLNDLLDLLSSNLQPQTICKIIEMCLSQRTITTSIPEFAESKDETLVKFENVVLHFPARDFSVQDINIFEPANVKFIADSVLVGTENCTFGPSYWCGNLTNSKECHSTSHCIGSVWSKKHYPDDTDSVCQGCKNMVKQARDQLLSNETQHELKQVFEGSCKHIPLEEVRLECIKLADKFVPELTEMLTSEMNPNSFCTVTELCNNPRIDMLLAKGGETVVDFSSFDSCSNCTAAFTSFHQFIKRTSKSEVLQRVLLICGEFSTFSDFCSTIIRDNFDEIYETMDNGLQPCAGCHLSGMCVTKYHTHSESSDIEFQAHVDMMMNTMKYSDDDDLPCDLCKQLVDHLKNVLVANTSEEEFHLILQGFCEQTGKYRTECLKLVNDNCQIIYKYLTEELDSQNICRAVQVCPKPRNMLTDENVNRFRILPILLPEDVELTALASKTPKKVANVECRICRLVVSEIEKELQNPEYDTNIEKILEHICKLVPHKDMQSCNIFIETYANTLIKLLATQTDPNIVCSLMTLCKEVNESIVQQKSNSWCPICQLVFHQLQNVLDDPKDTEKIKKELINVCSIVPSADRNKCVQFVSDYSDLIINVLDQEIDPSLVCPALKICPSVQRPERCGHCRTLINNLISSLNGNHEIGNIKSKMTEFLPVKGDRMSPVAVELHISHQEDIIDMIFADFNADESCVYLKYCEANQFMIPGNDINSNEIKSISGQSCQICQMLVTIYEQELTSNKTEHELEELLTKFCYRLKKTELKNECTNLVNKYLPEFLDLLKKNLSPNQLCTAVKFCPLKSLDSNECNECEVVIEAIKSVLGGPINSITIGSEVEGLCFKMSSKARQVCEKVIEQVLPQFESLVFNIPSWFVCGKINMCSYGDELDSSFCSTPEGQCQSLKNAFLCDKLAFCKNTAWKYSIPPSQ